MDNQRPVWAHKRISEAEFRRMWQFGMIITVSAKWEMTGADTTREWLEATNRSGDTMVMPRDWSAAWQFSGHASVPGLFGLTYDGDRMRETLEAIDKWEADNARDRAEFERLRKKFET